MLLFGGAAQFGIFFTVLPRSIAHGFPLRDAMSARRDRRGRTARVILVSQELQRQYMGAIAVAAYSYMALVPIIQPMAIRLVTTKEANVRFDALSSAGGF